MIVILLLAARGEAALLDGRTDGVFVLCVAMIVAAVIDFGWLKVPNWLTFPLILSGWLYGLGANLDWWSTAGGIGSSFALTFFGLALLLPVYLIGGMGEGDVKMQMGFGSWIGAMYGMSKGFAIVFYGFALGTIVGGVIAVVMILWQRQVLRSWINTHEIVRDLFSSSSLGQVQEKAAQRKPTLSLLPYGVPLCIGFLSLLLLRWLLLGEV
jgi:prepilin peptidase CpaA